MNSIARKRIKAMSGKRLYYNIQYYWVYKKGYPLNELKRYLGPRYAEYKTLPEKQQIPNKIVREYAALLNTSVSRLRLQDKKRNEKIDTIKRVRTRKYHLIKSDKSDEKIVSFITSITKPNNSIPKIDTTSKKWNDNDAKKLREFLENRKRGVIDDSEFDRGAIK